MVEIVFTLDYEIYGNGEGSLREFVFEPAERLRAIFRKWDAHFVVFAEVAELEMIEAYDADPAIDPIKQQVRNFQKGGFEIGLHIHPWWYSARRENGKWIFDYRVYNLCTQPKDGIYQIIDRAIAYTRKLLGDPNFAPMSFRAGHLLFQPTQPLSDALAERGIKLDSSVYKGGLWHQHKLDYRRAPKREPYWQFMDDVIMPESEGALLEVPIYTQMAPIWRLFTSKRVGLQQAGATARQTGKKILNRFSDIIRFRYPLKFDLGQMTMDEMTRIVDRAIREDQKNPTAYRPIVAIAHTKDPIDFAAVDSLLAYLGENGIKVSTFGDVYHTIRQLGERSAGRP
jgi:hypothetical protein